MKNAIKIVFKPIQRTLKYKHWFENKIDKKIKK